MNQAVIYARFSSDKQTEDSIVAQVRACREYAAGPWPYRGGGIRR